MSLWSIGVKDFSIGKNLLWALALPKLTSGWHYQAMHCCAISKKKFAITWVCEEKYGKGKNSKVPSLAIAPMISFSRGAAVERVIMIPRPPNVGPCLRTCQKHFATLPPSLWNLRLASLEKFAGRAFNWGKRLRRRAGKLSNLSKNPRLSVVRANFGRSGGKRKLEAKSITNVARWCLQQFPLFTICLCIWCAAL